MDYLANAKKKLDSWLSGDPRPLETPSDQTTEEQEIVNWVQAKLESRRMSSSRSANESIWLTNIAYYCGIDCVNFDATTRQFRASNLLPRSLSRSRVHVNKILPTVQNRTAKLCKNPPRWDVRPKSSDDADKDAARLSKAVLLQDWETCKINQKQPELLLWTQACGHAYLKVCWDDMMGPRDYIKKEDGTIELVHEGDKRVDVISPFSVFPDELAKSWDELNDLIEARIRPLNYYRDRYERGYMVKEEDCWLTSLSYEMRINAFNSQGGGQSQAGPLKNSAIELSYYEKPSKKHPMGRHIIVANGVLLKDGVLPIDELPWSKFDDVKVAGKYNSEAIITHLRSIQDQYNRNKSLRAAWINRTLMGKYISCRGHQLAAESFNTESGEIVEYDPVPNAPEPKALDVPSIPQYVYTEDEGLLGDINDVSGINQSSRGQMESASMPALGMQILVEQDDTRISLQTEANELAFADVGRILLKFTGKYYTKNRLLKEAGKSLDYVVKEFKGEDLRDNFDVHVIRGSTAPGSKVLDRQNIKTLHQEGYLGNPTDPTVIEHALSMLEYGDEFEAWKKQSLVNRSIKKGLDMVQAGIKPPVSEFDNHGMWIQQFDEFRLSDKFEALDDQKKSLVIQTMEEHLSWLQEMSAPETMEDIDSAPDLKETTAAQEMEQEALAGAPQDALGLAQTAPQLPLEGEV